ncbi:MAG: cob(I)yrinic acid a,c-diamide adenosyltransferase [Apibacter sp.]|jgi:cob(I)alamin adenosyltransferase|nr:cob(I)yrinic acid a,c-diamide adenosyltransferase [Apibacter sp.]
MKIYTKTGDDGTTSLYGGKRVSKNNIRVQTYGEVDELNSYIGLIRSHNSYKEIDDQLQSIQNSLFNLGAELASPSDQMFFSKGKMKSSCLISDQKIVLFEKWMDEMSEKLPPQKNFIIPTGNVTTSTSHIARTICRRAERSIVSLCEIEDVRPILQKYLNRLSDYLFVLARYFGYLANEPEALWNPNE